MKQNMRPKGILVDQKTHDAWRTLKENSINISCLIRNFLQREAAKYGGMNDH